MKMDVKSNFTLAVNVAFGVKAATLAGGTAVDMSEGRSVSFLAHMVLDGTAGTIAGKLQHSADGSTDWQDEDAGAGNSPTATLTGDAAVAQFNVVNPRRRYYRLAYTPSAADSNFGVVSVHGPLTSVSPG